MQITATEFKNNMGRYLSMASKHDIFITRNGRNIAKLTSPVSDKVALLDSLVGILPEQECTLASIRDERLADQ